MARDSYTCQYRPDGTNDCGAPAVQQLRGRWLCRVHHGAVLAKFQHSLSPAGAKPFDGKLPTFFGPTHETRFNAGHRYADDLDPAEIEAVLGKSCRCCGSEDGVESVDMLHGDQTAGSVRMCDKCGDAGCAPGKAYSGNAECMRTDLGESRRLRAAEDIFD